MTGFTRSQRRLIIERDRRRCLRCTGNRPSDIHHRLPRGAGGSPAANVIANGVLVCRSCHDWIESHRGLALAAGWLVQRGTDPASVPITDIWGRRFRLDQVGQVIEL